MNNEEILKTAQDLGWRYSNNSLIKTFEFANFEQGLEWIVNIESPICKRLDHYPSIMWEYNKLTLVSFTKDIKKVTELDLKFIETLEKENSLRSFSSKYL